MVWDIGGKLACSGSTMLVSDGRGGSVGTSRPSSMDVSARAATTIPAKHIVLDVVEFTHNRSVEAQTDIVHALNAIVKSSGTSWIIAVIARRMRTPAISNRR